MEALRKKLLYQSWHRGCKETDGVLGPFAETFLPHCLAEELAAFEALLEEDDWDIWHWLTVPGTAPERHTGFIDRIRDFQHNRGL